MERLKISFYSCVAALVYNVKSEDDRVCSYHEAGRRRKKRRLSLDILEARKREREKKRRERERERKSLNPNEENSSA